MDARCEQCGNTVDMLTAFTKYKVCGKCTRKNHRKRTGRVRGLVKHKHKDKS